MALHKFIPNEPDLIALKQAASLLKAANSAAAAAKKSQEAAKEQIAGWLKSNRNLNLDDLPIGDLVIIEGAIAVKIGKRESFDQKGFSLAEGDLFAKWTRPFPVKNFDPLV